MASSQCLSEEDFVGLISKSIISNVDNVIDGEYSTMYSSKGMQNSTMYSSKGMLKSSKSNKSLQ